MDAQASPPLRVTAPWRARVSATHLLWMALIVMLAIDAGILFWFARYGAQQRTAHQASTLFAQGWQNMADGNDAAAERLFLEFLHRGAQYPQREIERAQVLCYLGRLADKQSRPQDAERYYEQGSALLAAQMYPPRYHQQPPASALRQRCATMI